MGRILFLFSMLGGSHASGLATRDSDEDYRGVFLNADVATAGGLDRREHVTRTTPRDECYHELRHFLQPLRKGNTGALELLFSQELVYR
ncbi:MAG: nucleotidyltransferase domain-containing protein, partial [Candidatus Methylacidiphilales bacterium]|nr:nucleotidyltransferase domain-containing protein [Candidatus Methylacidiphilales bacterium]